MQILSRRERGFTIVELLIVIVVIAILAAITIVAYNGIQTRARDTQRVADMNSIVKALELYKAQNGQYPAAVGNSAGGWEISSNTNGNWPFLKNLVNAGIVNSIPVDPVNTGDMATPGSKIYAYYRYAAGYAGCDASRGPFYVLVVRTGEGSVKSPSSPDNTCGTYGVTGWWFKQSYTD
jgi:prepilin-type N-terminal cleavage/methylation domain-containing protein